MVPENSAVTLRFIFSDGFFIPSGGKNPDEHKPPLGFLLGPPVTEAAWNTGF